MRFRLTWLSLFLIKTFLTCDLIPDPLCGECYNSVCYYCHSSYPDFNGICQIPEIKIDQCESYKNRSTCQRCQSGYHSEGNVCIKSLLQGCDISLNHFQCLKCNGHLRKADYTCDSSKRCETAHCQSCIETVSGQECHKCYKSYILRLDVDTMKYSCVFESNSTQNCQLLFNNTCKRCMFGYSTNSERRTIDLDSCERSEQVEIDCEESFLIDFSCKNGNDQYCLKCGDLGCQVCSQSYPDSKGLCIRPSVVIPGCESYKDESTCLVCLDGYYFNKSTCIKTEIPNCYHPKNETECQYCNGFLLKEDNTCDSETKCSMYSCHSCKMINGTNTCTRCHDKYILDISSNSCVSEFPSNPGCKLLQNNKCVFCDDGFYMANKFNEKLQCVSSQMYLPGESLILLDKKPSCSLYNDEFCGACAGQKCSVCYKSFQNPFGVCEVPKATIDYCQKYRDWYNCELCDVGYYVKKGICIPNTLDGCYIQYSDKICLSCDGFMKLGNSHCDLMTKCSMEGCRSCYFENKIEHCNYCEDDYILRRFATEESIMVTYICEEKTNWPIGCGYISGDKCQGCQYGFYVQGINIRGVDCQKSSKYEFMLILRSAAMILFICLLG